MPVSTDIIGNDIRNVDDNCIEADGGAQNFRVIGNRCFNMAHRALSTQPALGGPIYFIRNIVYNAPEGGALKLTANSAGVLVYNNTLLSEAHQMGPASNLHFRNNLILAREPGLKSSPSKRSRRGRRRTSTDFPQRRPVLHYSRGRRRLTQQPTTMPGQRARCNRSPTLKAYSDRTGQDSHSRMIDWSIFRKASPPAAGRSHAALSPRRLRFQPDCQLRRHRCRHGSARRHGWLHRQGAGSGRTGIRPAGPVLRPAAAYRPALTALRIAPGFALWT